jgi:multiple sugar transport system permease protein/raffinose/stachyose/melibiose transport system permease protein
MATETATESATEAKERVVERKLSRSGDWYRHVLLLLVCFCLFFPYILTINMSVKSIPQFDHQPFGITVPFFFDNYYSVNGGAWPIVSKYLLNSVFISGVTVVGVVGVAALAAYVYARFSFPGKEIMFYMVLALLMIPGILTLVPSFILVKSLGLYNSWWGLILPYIAGGQVFAMFILRQFFAAIPEELFESARIDGASELRAFWTIAVPLSQSILGVVAIMNILGTWNDLIWPLVILSDRTMYTLTLGLWAFRGEYWNNWGPLFAGYVIASIPLLLLFPFTSKLFVEGLTSGALKL